MASKRISKELKDLQKDPPASCSAGLLAKRGCEVRHDPASVHIDIFGRCWRIKDLMKLSSRLWEEPIDKTDNSEAN